MGIAEKGVDPGLHKDLLEGLALDREALAVLNGRDLRHLQCGGERGSGTASSGRLPGFGNSITGEVLPTKLLRILLLLFPTPFCSKRL